MEFSIIKNKLGKTICPFSITSSTDCVSRQLGLCQLKNSAHCYARISEKRFSTVLPFRRRQAKAWDCQSVESIASDIVTFCNRRGIVEVRFNESGDFRNQDDVDKLKAVARLLPDLTFYGYTARKDLSFASRPKNLAINGSNWMRGNMNKFKAVFEYSVGAIRCKGDCSVCSLCKIEKGIVIENKMHGSVFNLRK